MSSRQKLGIILENWSQKEFFLTKNSLLNNIIEWKKKEKNPFLFDIENLG